MSLPVAPDGDARPAQAGAPFAHEVVGARGGQATTTVAMTLALAAAAHGRTVLGATRPGDVAALAGVPEGQSARQVAAGLNPGGPGPGGRLARGGVGRGPRAPERPRAPGPAHVRALAWFEDRRLSARAATAQPAAAGRDDAGSTAAPRGRAA